MRGSIGKLTPAGDPEHVQNEGYSDCKERHVLDVQNICPDARAVLQRG